jgi:hypothetical protein
MEPCDYHVQVRDGFQAELGGYDQALDSSRDAGFQAQMYHSHPISRIIAEFN